MDTNTVGCSVSGASDEKIAAVSRYRESSLFSREERVALELAEGMTHTPVDVSDAVFDEARACFSDEQLVELVATIAMENYRARFNRAFGVESQNFAERQARRRASR